MQASKTGRKMSQCYALSYPFPSSLGDSREWSSSLHSLLYVWCQLFEYNFHMVFMSYIEWHPYFYHSIQILREKQTLVFNYLCWFAYFIMQHVMHYHSTSVTGIHLFSGNAISSNLSTGTNPSILECLTASGGFCFCYWLFKCQSVDGPNTYTCETFGFFMDVPTPLAYDLWLGHPWLCCRLVTYYERLHNAALHCGAQHSLDKP